MPRLIPFLILFAVLTALAWGWPNRATPAGPAVPDGKLASVSFAPFRPGQSPLTNSFPTAAQVEADIALLAPRTRAIRTYASIEGGYTVANIAARHGLHVLQGAWLGRDRAQNTRELDRLVAIANAHPETVTMAIVGNEVLLRRDLLPSELVAAITSVKARVAQPVTYADVWEFWEQFPEVAQAVDVVTIHILPYWEDEPRSVAAAMAHVTETVRRIGARFPGKPIFIGEIGWPSRGRWRADAAPGRVEQARFVRGFLALAGAEGFSYNLIEAFDQNWKAGSEGTVGASWGLYTASRVEKFPFAGPVVEDPAWPWKAGASVLLGLGLLGATLARVKGLLVADQARLAGFAFLLGSGLVWAAGGFATAFDAWQIVAWLGNVSGQAVLAALAMRRAALIATGHAFSAPRTLVETTRTVQGLFRLRLDPANWRAWVEDDLLHVFLFAAAVLAALMAIDPRYRDFPLASLAVPALALAARSAQQGFPRRGGGAEEALLAGALAVAAVVIVAREGVLNLQALAFAALCLFLAAWPALRLRRPAP